MKGLTAPEKIQNKHFPLYSLNIFWKKKLNNIFKMSILKFLDLELSWCQYLEY